MAKQYTITIFKLLSLTSTPYHKNVVVALDRIRTGADLKIVNQVRMEPDKHKRNELKKLLPAFLFSGVFRHRSAAGIISASGIMCLDFDGFDNNEELLLYKKALTTSKEKSKYTMACFISPSNNGLKVLVKVPPVIKDHKAYFLALKEFYDDKHFDTGVFDICRTCFSSYDPDLYYNPDSEEWVEMETNETYNISETVPILRLRAPVGIIQSLQKWFSKKYKMNEGEKNNSLYVFAAAFNDFGIPKHECEQYLQSQYGSKKTEKEINLIIKSAYKREGGTKFFEDKQSLELIDRQIRSGVERKKIVKKLSEHGHSEDDVDNAIKILSDSMPISEFWSWNDKGKCIIKNFRFKQFLEQYGFYKYYPEGSKSFIFIRIENNMIETVTPDIIKSFVLNYLQEQSSLDPYETVSDATKMFKDDYLNLLGVADINFYEDTADKGVVYFNNGAALVKTTRTDRKEETALGERTVTDSVTEVELVDYLNLNGYVWKQYIVDRDYEVVDFKGCVYDRFLSFIGGGKPEKILAIKSTIGYLMHSFKTSANNKAVILNDETISDNPNGGSGKGIFCNALSHIRRLEKLNGKIFDGAKSFAYQTVDPSVQILVYDDIPKNFQFEILFSVVTEGITLEKKNKDAIKLSVADSPKILITTNYTIGGVGGSHDRRKWEVEFSSHFNSNHTPLHEFGHQLFDEWDTTEWKKFDNCMIDCLRIYLEQGLVKQDFTNLAERKFIKETSFDFHEWVTDEPIPANFQIGKKKYYEKFIEEYPDYNSKVSKWFTQKKFSIWLRTYGEYKGYRVIDGKTMGEKWLQYISKEHTEAEVLAITKPAVEEVKEQENYDALFKNDSEWEA